MHSAAKHTQNQNQTASTEKDVKQGIAPMEETQSLKAWHTYLLMFRPHQVRITVWFAHWVLNGQN